ncbi:MAG: tripartite tricarboxylate transporter substrate binding protein [Burkholderiales bacterium]|nr:tripartite tricarboxylate transporter substrate binding protein [Burkholderiales bacterium]
MPMSRRQLLLATTPWVTPPLAAPAWAQPRWPERPITLIDPFSAGSNTDYFSRALADELARLLGQPVVVDNRAGSGGAVGAEAVARAKADGHTLGLASVSTMAANPALNKALRYDPLKDFTPISTLVTLPSATVVLASSPHKSLKDLLAAARAKPATLSFASPGVGSAGHVLLEQFSHLAGVKFIHVPYRGSGQILNDLLGGQVDVASDNIPSLLPHIKSGRLRALALRDQQRLPQLPEVPSFKELGFEPVSRPLWFGLVAPPGLPRELQRRLNEAVQQAVRTPAFVQKTEAVAGTVAAGTPEQFQALVLQWLEQFKATVATARITME